MLGIIWKEVTVTFTGNKSNLPTVVTIKTPKQNHS